MKKIGQFVVILILCVVAGTILTSIFSGDIGGIGGSDIGIGDGAGGGGSTGDNTGNNTGGSSGGSTVCYHTGNVNDSHQMLDQADSQYLTMHLYSSVCFDCGETIVSPKRVMHSYTNGVCQCGYLCDHPSVKSDGVHCAQCNEAINITFAVEGTTYSVVNGATWADVVEKYNIFTVSENKVFLNEKCLVDGLGYSVHLAYKVIAQEDYFYCPHTQHVSEVWITDEDTVSTHTYAYICNACNDVQRRKEGCTFNGGLCVYCSRLCYHYFSNGKCTICQLVCTHNYVDGVCSICHDGCDHTWSGGSCSVCGSVCNHPGEYPEGKCEVCGYQMAIFYINDGVWVIRNGAPWSEVVSRYTRFTIDEKNRVRFDGEVLIGSNGEAVKLTDTIVSGNRFALCTHTGATTTYRDNDDSGHEKKVVCGVCDYMESAYELHDYVSSVCTECSRECGHSSMNNGSCNYCGKVAKVIYVNDHYTYSFDSETTWASLAGSNEDFSIVDGVVNWRGYILTDAEGYAVKATDAMQANGKYQTCQHLHLDENILYSKFNADFHIGYQYCSVCDVLVNEIPEWHVYEEGTCKSCNYVCPHVLGEDINETCDKCGYKWFWFTVNGQLMPFVRGMTYGALDAWLTPFDNADGVYMTYQNKALKYQDGTQVKATDEIGVGDVLLVDHNFDENGICTDCGAECRHGIHDQDAVCTTCGKQVTHGTDNFEGNVCAICGYVCPHNSFIDQDCVYCGRRCTHDVYSNGVCTSCGRPCFHVWENGSCTVCALSCSHNWQDGACTVCGQVCSHPLGDGIMESCEICGYTWSWFMVNGQSLPFVRGMTYGDLDGWLALFDNVDGSYVMFQDKFLKHENGSFIKVMDTILPGEKIYTDHVYDENGVCTICGEKCPHTLGDGIMDNCETCGYKWSWFTVDGCLMPFAEGMVYGELDGWLAFFDNADGVYMTYQGKALKYQDGGYVKATDNIGPGDVLMALHTYNDEGICTDCGAECRHGIHDQDGCCTTCGKDVPCEYVNGVCKVCGKEEE